MLFSNSPGRPAKKQQIGALQTQQQTNKPGQTRLSVPELPGDIGVPPVITKGKKDKKEKGYSTVGKQAKLRKALNKMNLLQSKSVNRLVLFRIYV